MRNVKWIGFLAAAAVVLGGVAAKFSGAEVRYQCEGEIYRAQSDPTVASVEFGMAEYRWWKRLWSGSDGSLWIESPQEIAQLYLSLRAKEEYLGRHWSILNSDGKERGGFSTSDGMLAIETPAGLFAGKCLRVDA
jgi:hypothetical protein